MSPRKRPDKILAKVKKSDDLEIHVKTYEAGPLGGLVQLREFIPSAKTYGRGIVFDRSLAPEIIKALEDV